MELARPDRRAAHAGGGRAARAPARRRGRPRHDRGRPRDRRCRHERGRRQPGSAAVAASRARAALPRRSGVLRGAVAGPAAARAARRACLAGARGVGGARAARVLGR